MRAALDGLVLSFLAQVDPAATEAPAGQTQPADPLSQAADAVSNFNRDEAIGLAQQYGIPLAKAVVVLVVVLLLAGWARRLTMRILIRSRLELTLAKFFGSLTKWAIVLLGGVVILGILGIETASFAVVLGAAGFAIGMALQGSLGHLASGVMLLIFRPFKVSQVVTVAGVTGKVDEVGLFSTTVDTFDNRRFVIPNGAIFGSVIENISFHGTRRAEVSVGVDYSASIERTREVLLEAANSLDGTLDDPGPAVLLGDLGDSAVNWIVRVWAPAGDFGTVKQALTQAVKDHLDQAAIGIPFPQMDIHLDKPALGG